mgnify:CR=1 FL=1
MANDDRILLNLVLNETTVSAVEGRVRNLVNRLNNQNISLNINGRNLDNILNRLNDIQQRMQTINSTPVNINANLTSAQQQYRLETERMRVAQQLELSRQRTLQTENQAISALAQQNRTLTVNNNVTHQIEQGAQNIGHNMNVAGGHARDFVDYLADGVRYIVVYRSLYEIMNQIGEAFSEMKNVDKELISVRKTTGMAENEIEKIRKASYGVATEYGRTASEYLGSVSEFARGGYKELSTELAKVSLLTQNVGDVSADSANKMLLSVDAAYKLNGNVTELTNVVNGLNNIANLNPTSMQKMADGMQVSASMAKVAGLEISDLVALIGVGTAVSQREGSEIARALRTILMNIRQVKGELEDGTVIDDDSIAKAEAALKGVGIATKEVVNGVRELRDPMDILDELAGKWSTLNTEAQSVVLESLANKRQANVLAAILENYEMVGKMQREYFNSANSAIKENELYLQGWEATQKRVSAKWTEFVANMADTALITGSLNALYGVLVALDTPIGRIATSIVLVNTALAVSGRLWQAIRARSIVADILSMGVAERNLGTAIQLVTGHLGRQIAQWAMSPFGMATIAVAGIALITSAIEKNSQKLEENAQKAGEAYDKVKQNMNELDDLIKQYNDLQISNEWDNTPVETKKQLHEDINKLLGDEADKVDILNGKYKETTEELFKQRMSKLPGEEKKAFDNEQAKGKSLWDTAYWNGGGGAGGYNYGTMQATDAEKKFIEKYEKIFDKKNYSAGRGMSGTDYVVRFDNFDDFMMKYEEAKKMLQELYDEGMGESELYKGLNSFIAKFDTKVGEYKTAVEELESTKAGQKLADYINTSVGGYVDDLDEYKIVVDWIKSNFTGKDADNALGLLNAYFSEYAEKVNTATENVNKMTVSLADSLDNLEKTKNSIKTLSDGLKEFEEEGSLSFNSISAIGEAFSDVDGIENYIARLSDAGLTSQEFREISGELTIALIEQKLETGELADADEKLVAKMLKEAGVANSAEVAHEMLTKAKVMQYIKTLDLNNVTNAEIQELTNLARQCGVTEQQLSLLTRAMEILANTDLNLGDKCTQLLQMAATAGIAMASLGTASSLLTDMQNGSIGALKQQEYSEKSITDLYRESIQETLNYFSGLSGEIVNIPATTYKPSKDKKNKESDTVSKPDFNDFDTDTSYYSEIEAWLEEGDRQITNIDSEISTLNKKLENTLETGNIEEAKIWEKALNEKLTEKQNLLHSYNEANRTTMDSLIKEIWSIAPELDGKSWDEITEVEKSQVIKRYEDAITLAKNNVITVQNAGKQALYNYDVAHNGKDKNEAERVEIEDANKATEKSAQAGVDSAEAILNKVKGIFNDAKLVSEDIKDNSEEWWNVDSTRISNYKALIDGQETFSNTWLENEIAFNRISEAGQMKAYGRMINNMKEFQKKILADETLSAEAREALWKYTNEKIIQYGKDAYTKGFSAIENAMSEALDEFNDEIESKTEYHEFRRSKIDSRHTLLQKYFEVVNAISDASHEIDKELRASKAMEEYLDKNTRKLLFNDEDYKVLSDELKSLSSQADILKSNYNRAISGAGKEELEEITSEYERQYDLLMKSYEIKKAELDLIKKKQKLENVLAERNVRMRINGKWIYVANTQDVINAQNEVSDSEYTLEQAKTGKSQNQELNKLSAESAALGTIINELQTEGERFNEQWEKLHKKMLNQNSDITSILKAIKNGECKELKDIMNLFGKEFTSLYNEISKKNIRWDGNSSGNYNDSDISYGTATTPEGTEVVVHMKDGKTITEGLRPGTVVHTQGGDYEITGGDAGNYTSKKKYATGSKYTQQGFALMGEDGYETFISSNGHLIPINQPTFGNIEAGGIVFNRDQMDFARKIWDWSNVGTLPTSSISNFINRNSGETVNYNMYGDAILNGDAPKAIFKQLADFMQHNKYKSC